MNIIITGSLGNIGRPLTQQLIQAGHSVTVISSNIDKTAEIEASKATAAIGKLEDSDFLTQTFSGADAVYCMTPFDFAEQDQEGYFKKIADSYVKAIKAAGIKHAVILTGWAADVETSHNPGQILDQLSDISIAELRPGVFYSNFYGYITMIKSQGAIMANFGGDDKIAFVSPNDIATAAYEELTTMSEGKRVRFVASEEMTCNEAAGILGEAIGIPDLKWITLTDEQMLDAFISFGLPIQLAQDLVNMQAAMHSGTVYNSYLNHRPFLGRTKLKDFAKDFAAAYHQQK